MADSNASAVVLGEYGVVEVDKAGRVKYDYHLRVKLLTEASYDEWGTYELPYWDGDFSQRIERLQAQTFVLENGKEKRHKLGKKSIYKETITGDWKRYKFTFPALKPGAVVELRYTMLTDNPIYLPDWTFQHSEPTRWSEYRATIANQLGYVQVANNTSFTIIESQPINGPDGDATQHRWAMNDVPALREEPFITTLEDYRARIEFQLSSYFTFGTGVVQYMNTWDKLAEELRAMDGFGKALKASRQVRRQTESIIQGLNDPHEKVTAIEQFVRNSINWNGEYGFIADKSLGDVLKTSTGSCAEQSLLLISMLKEAGIEAYPVLLSTRNHGAIQSAYPMHSQFNYVIAYANVAGKEYFIDVTEPLAPMDMLPLRALNGQGWLIMDNSEQWINVQTSEKYFQLITFEGELDTSGGLSGKLQAASKGYGALGLRKRLQDTDKSEVVEEEVLDGLDEIEFFDTQVNNLENLGETLEIQTNVRIPSFAQQAGDYLYAGTHAIGQLEENPLRLKKRTFPVDLGFPHDYIFTFRINLPEGYEVQELPKDMRLAIPEKGGSFQRTTTHMDGMLVIQSRFVLAKPKYEPRHYASLKEIYDRVVAAQAEQIVLKKRES